MLIDTLIEGITDEAVAKKLIVNCQHEFGIAYGKRGHGYLREKATGFNERAKYGNPILMLVDFADTGSHCPPAVPEEWLPHRSRNMLLRVVVRELESWLLADPHGLARFLGISPGVIPKDPEKLSNPKQTLVNLARRSRLRKIREGIVPRQGVTSVVGPGYVDALEEFVANYWDIGAAVQTSRSLASCLTKLRSL